LEKLWADSNAAMGEIDKKMRLYKGLRDFLPMSNKAVKNWSCAKAAQKMPKLYEVQAVEAKGILLRAVVPGFASGQEVSAIQMVERVAESIQRLTGDDGFSRGKRSQIRRHQRKRRRINQ
jgi:hypothetical protein